MPNKHMKKTKLKDRTEASYDPKTIGPEHKLFPLRKIKRHTTSSFIWVKGMTYAPISSKKDVKPNKLYKNKNEADYGKGSIGIEHILTPSGHSMNNNPFKA
ncbi:hypothetical protein C4B25_04205 [Mycoplasma todarodis]|uniref:Uncharacterized protein n=2 Tax=Mycoplasma todarodis TaxID=1937191 RepID=A0A4R0XJ39_9MOLU|nr:hypothetical protein C4B25_04205 [Mycoplasma todarodis]